MLLSKTGNNESNINLRWECLPPALTLAALSPSPAQPGPISTGRPLPTAEMMVKIEILFCLCIYIWWTSLHSLVPWDPTFIRHYYNASHCWPIQAPGLNLPRHALLSRCFSQLFTFDVMDQKDAFANDFLTFAHFALLWKLETNYRSPLILNGDNFQCPALEISSPHLRVLALNNSYLGEVTSSTNTPSGLM